MGEMADFYIEQHMNAFPDDFWVRKESSRPVCKYCGMRGLKWKETDSGWRLVTPVTELVHTCKEYFEKKVP